MAKKQKTNFLRNKNVKTVLIGVTIVMFWRGTWGLMDLYLFPDQPTLSFSASLFIGLILLFILNHRRLRDLG